MTCIVICHVDGTAFDFVQDILAWVFFLIK